MAPPRRCVSALLARENWLKLVYWPSWAAGNRDMGDRVRVIVVDDEPDLREMVAAYLGKYGFVVDAVADGGGFRREVQPRRQQRRVGFPIPNAGLLRGFQGTKTARREGISSPFSDAGGCTSPQNSGMQSGRERENGVSAGA